MSAVYKKELRSYFTSMIGPVFIAFVMLFIGIYFVTYNVISGIRTFGYTLYGASFIFMLSVPILTMRSFSEEQKNRTDQLLYTSPAGTYGIVAGKYLALVSVMLIVCLLSCFCPLIIASYGSDGLLCDYSCILAFFLVGAAYIAIGMFISALTENQIIACVTSVALFFVLYYVRDLSTLVGTTALDSACAFALLAAAAGLLAYALTKDVWTGVIIGLIGCVAVLGFYLLAPAMLEGAFPAMLRSLSLVERFSDFVYKMFSWKAVIYYLSLIAFFVFLTVQVIEKRRWS